MSNEKEIHPEVEQPLLEQIISAMLEDLGGNPDFVSTTLAALRELAEQGRLSSVNGVIGALAPEASA